MECTESILLSGALLVLGKRMYDFKFWYCFASEYKHQEPTVHSKGTKLTWLHHVREQSKNTRFRNRRRNIPRKKKTRSQFPSHREASHIWCRGPWSILQSLILTLRDLRKKWTPFILITSCRLFSSNVPASFSKRMVFSISLQTASLRLSSGHTQAIFSRFGGQDRCWLCFLLDSTLACSGAQFCAALFSGGDSSSSPSTSKSISKTSPNCCTRCGRHAGSPSLGLESDLSCLKWDMLVNSTPFVHWISQSKPSDISSEPPTGLSSCGSTRRRPFPWCYWRQCRLFFPLVWKLDTTRPSPTLETNIPKDLLLSTALRSTTGYHSQSLLITPLILLLVCHPVAAPGGARFHGAIDVNVGVSESLETCWFLNNTPFDHLEPFLR